MMMVCLLLVIVSGAFARNISSAQSAVGTWNLNATKSSSGNMPAPKFEQMVVSVDTPDALKWNVKGASADGKTYIFSYDGPVDGKEHAMVSPELGRTVAYTRTSSGLTWIVKNKPGAVIETGTSKLSPDGKTLTLSGSTQGPNGKVNFISVFDKIH
jgi:hypothetical protein